MLLSRVSKDTVLEYTSPITASACPVLMLLSRVSKDTVLEYTSPITASACPTEVLS